MSIPELMFAILYDFGFGILNISTYMLKYMEICSAPSYGLALLLPMVLLCSFLWYRIWKILDVEEILDVIETLDVLEILDIIPP